MVFRKLIKSFLQKLKIAEFIEHLILSLIPKIIGEYLNLPSIANIYKSFSSVGLNTMKKLSAPLFSGSSTVDSSGGGGVASAVENVAGGVASAVGGVASVAGGVAGGVASAVGSTVSETTKVLSDTVSGAENMVLDTSKNIINNVSSVIPESVSNIASSLPGVHTASNLMSGVSSMVFGSHTEEDSKKKVENNNTTKSVSGAVAHLIGKAVKSPFSAVKQRQKRQARYLRTRDSSGFMTDYES